MSNMICTADQNMGFFPKNEYQAMINSLAVCSGLFKVDYAGADVTAFNGKVMPWATPAMKIRVKDIAGSSRGVQIGNKSLQDDYLKFDGNVRGFTLAAAHATLPRIDAVYAVATKRPNEKGIQEIVSHSEFVIIGVKTGTPAASPVAPAVNEYPDGEILLAKVLVRPAATSILASDIADCRDFIIPTCEQFEGFSAAIEAMQADIAQLQSDFADLQIQVGDNLADVIARVMALEGNDSAQDTAIASLQSQITALDIMILGVNADIQTIVNRLSPAGDIGAAITQNQAQIAAIQVTLAALATLVGQSDAQLAADIAALQASVTTLSAALADVQADLVAQAALIAGNYSDLSASLAALDIRIAALEAGGSNIWTQAEKDDVLADVAQLQTDVASLQACACPAEASELYENALADIAAGDYTAVPAEGDRAFGLEFTPGGGGGGTLFTDDFATPTLDLVKWSAINTGYVISGSAFHISSATVSATAFCSAAAGTFAVGAKSYKCRWLPKAGNAMASGAGMSTLNSSITVPYITMMFNPNNLGSPTDTVSDRFAMAIRWAFGDGDGSHFTLSPGLGGGTNTMLAMPTVVPDFYYPMPAGLPIAYVDIEAKIFGDTIEVYLAPEGQASMLAFSGTFDLAAPFHISGKYAQAQDATHSVGFRLQQAGIDNVEVAGIASGGTYAASAALVFNPGDSDVVANAGGYRVLADIIPASVGNWAVTFDMSFDAGATWPVLDAPLNLDQLIPDQGNAPQDVRFRVNLSNDNTAATPVVRNFSIRTDQIPELGRIKGKVNEILAAAVAAADGDALRVALAAITQL